MTEIWNLNWKLEIYYYYYHYYTSVLPVVVHNPCQRPIRTSHLWFYNDKLIRRNLDPMTFVYFLAVENNQCIKPSWQRMNNLI